MGSAEPGSRPAGPVPEPPRPAGFSTAPTRPPPPGTDLRRTQGQISWAPRTSDGPRAVLRLEKAGEDEATDQTAGSDNGTPPENGEDGSQPSDAAATVETTD